MNIKIPPGLAIVDETPQDIAGIRSVNRLAFDGEYEVEVIDQLRLNCEQICSLVAKAGDEVVGHILFSPAKIIRSDGRTVEGMALGPLAVHPAHQGAGIGTALCQAGMQRMEETGYPFVIVLGHPGYYPRFGFRKASSCGIACAFEGVPDEAFMIRIYDGDVLAGATGTAYYRAEFGSVV